MSENSSIKTQIINTYLGIIGTLYEATIAVLLPAKGRPKILRESLFSLAETNGADCLEIIIVADQDPDVYDVAKMFPYRGKFAAYRVFLSSEWLMSVRAFCKALELSKSFWITWMNDENLYSPSWLTKAFGEFTSRFPDHIGVLSLYKPKKAGLGITSRRFIEYNEGEFFYPGYNIYYPDDELTCRAILLGRYGIVQDSGIVHRIEITKKIPIISPEEKMRLKKVDRSTFYNRTDHNFYLSQNKIYKWEGFRELNLPLKG